MYPEGQEILVVIAERERRERVARLLCAEGFAVTEAAEGLAALRAVNNGRYELVIAGAQLPGSLDSTATVRQARLRQPWLKALYIEECGIRRHRAGCHGEDVIAAPFERHELIGCTFELLQRGAVEMIDLARRARTELRAC